MLYFDDKMRLYDIESGPNILDWLIINKKRKRLLLFWIFKWIDTISFNNDISFLPVPKMLWFFIDFPMDVAVVSIRSWNSGGVENMNVLIYFFGDELGEDVKGCG